MSKFNVGDIVLVTKPDNDIGWVSSMDSYNGKTMTIHTVEEDGWYLLENGDGWQFCESWLSSTLNTEIVKVLKGIKTSLDIIGFILLGIFIATVFLAFAK